MTFRMVTLRSTAIAFALLGLIGTASATVPSLGVKYSVSGSAGDWSLDFSVANNMVGTTQSVYFFGVAVDQSAVVRSPYDFDPSTFATWSNQGYGGSSTVYDDNWYNSSSETGATAGSVLSGFVVHSTTVMAPTSVAWFAYSEGEGFGGSDAFSTSISPGFEGLATPVPEPTSLALLAGGLLMLGAPRLRRARAR